MTRRFVGVSSQADLMGPIGILLSLVWFRIRDVNEREMKNIH
jgi:hypothetical protein